MVVVLLSAHKRLPSIAKEKQMLIAAKSNLMPELTFRELMRMVAFLGLTENNLKAAKTVRFRSRTARLKGGYLWESHRVREQAGFFKPHEYPAGITPLKDEIGALVEGGLGGYTITRYIEPK